MRFFRGFSRSSSLVALLSVLICSRAFSQDTINRWKFSIGLSNYNIFADNSLYTTSGIEAFQGHTLNPFASLQYKLNSRNYIGFQYEYGVIFTTTVHTGGNSLSNIKHNYQLNYNYFIRDNRYLILGASFIDQKWLNYFPRLGPRRRIIDDFGPAIGLGLCSANGYEIELLNDVLWDFIEEEFSFIIGGFRMRVKKVLFAPDDYYKEESGWPIYISVGSHIAYNHYRKYYDFMPYLQKKVFADLAMKYDPWRLSFFWRRSLWIDIEPETTTAQSEFIITNNLGFLRDSPSNKWKYGASYFVGRESLYDEILYSQDSTFHERLYPYQGISLHLDKKIANNLYLSSQLDMPFNLPSFASRFDERFRFNLGLRYVLL